VSEPPSLRITTVLYENDVDTVDRLVQSVVRSVEHARSSGACGAVSYHIGDCSSRPALAERDVERVLTGRGGGVLADVGYEFFGANLGHAGGSNRLLEGATEDVVFLVNPDCYLGPHLVEQLLAAFTDAAVGLAEARQLPAEHPKAYDPFSLRTGWSSLACAAVRQTAVQRVGPLDGDCFPMYCNDVDWSWRLRLAGFTLAYQPSAVVFHDKRVDTDGRVRPSGTEEYYAAEAGLLLRHKYSRPDLVSGLLRQLEEGPPVQRRAAEAYRVRLSTGALPAALDAEHRVAEFVDGNYARHRW